ncbi:putative transcriptional regulator, AraC family [Phaeobacter piscinae]|uniref:Transcriptional regulator, AraC family n=1 Tax=Phaeobacter piscinae TaxID=1580596 RepID=A0AAN1GNP4_9RHOB|nr:NAD(P)H-binding protein [Phaeobacter piscinae]ATG42159.1 putative transcriptional regulator, AraC family [Phaeobacter piscinae]AUQ75680.1 putative transcriptional regulator, AraC family [Phaeobacter piscinae]AUR34492.1 putative transcriptional regulator, AraC family [Phaeobacter piscinae]
MDILLFGATGDVGRATVQQAIERGHRVTAIARNPDLRGPLGDQLVTPLPLDVLTSAEQLADLARRHQIIISALRPIAGQDALLVELTQAVLRAAEAGNIPALITGGAALLKLADGSGETVLSAPGFLPDAVRPIAEACAAQDHLLESTSHVDWTCLRPPAMLQEGERRDRYEWGNDTLVTDADGLSQISFADFGGALMDLAEQQNHPEKRLTVAWGNA